MSRHVFNTYAPRSRDCEGRYSMGFTARDSKNPKRSEFFQDFPDPEDGPAYIRTLKNTTKITANSIKFTMEFP